MKWRLQQVLFININLLDILNFKLFDIIRSREIHRIYAAHAGRSFAISFIGVYVPVFLLTLHYSFQDVIFFYITLHLTGLFFTFFVIVPLIQKWGLMQVLKLYYPFEVLFFLSLYFLEFRDIPIWFVATLGGIANFVYWVPLNILFVKHMDAKKAGGDLSLFFAFPKFFRILGPLVSAFLILFIGFWPVFAIAMFGLVLSYLPLMGIAKSEISVSLQLTQTLKKLRKRKFLFFLEGFDNIIEESEWFWGIFVFLMIGSFLAPGIVGSLESLGGVLFTLIVGRYVNHDYRKPLIIASVAFIFVWLLRIFIETPLSAYVITVFASFLMTLFLVSYFSMIFKSVKDRDEEEFLILREIPTVLGRMVVFGVILLTASSLRLFFILPMLTLIILLVFLFVRRRQFLSV